jgi:primosomal replication protein N
LSEPANRVEISGVITELKALRYTPAGLPVVEFRLRHASERAEAGGKRKVEAELEGIAFDAQARLLAGGALGRPLKAEGFLCAKSRRSKKPVLHVTNIEFMEGV